MDREQENIKELRIHEGKKKITGVLLIVLAFLILLTGTFAWYYIVNAVNEFDGKLKQSDSSAVLHDDFDEQGEEGVTGDIVHNKDVYVENTGVNPIFIRIRLDEYMEINGESLLAGADIDNVNTWEPHIPKENNHEECEEDFHKYWIWKFGGTTEYVPSPSGYQGVVSRYDSDGNDTLVIGALGNEKTQGGIPTTVMNMEAYTELTNAGKIKYDGWIYDADGYAYWSQRLQPNEATGLLLDRVSLRESFEGGTEYYYAINVVMETVDEVDVNAWLNGTPTSDGENPKKVGSNGAATLLKTLSDQYTYITTAMRNTTPSADEYDLDKDGYLNADELKTYNKVLNDE